jgi:oxygen-independent coproporphyrinogen III oxidase
MITSLYIHIPFCRRKCLYCDFYSAIYDERLASSYVGVLLKQLDGLAGPYSTVYVGGGTPTALDSKLLADLFKALKRFSRQASEFTVEANPDSLGEDKIKLFLDAGVNRLSIGVQSAMDEKLKKLGRLHDWRKALGTVEFAAKRGFKNISIDMIFGVWGEAPETWKKELGEVVGLPVTHVSCYSLTYEKGTPLYFAVQNGSVRPLEDEVTAAMYETAIDELALRGFKQYEVSNFSKESFECMHNLNYWDNNPYVGLGASAVSYIDGVRSKFVCDAAEYVRNFEAGRPLIESSEKLSPEKRAKETAALKIRTKEGIDFRWFLEKTGFDLPALEKKAVADLLEKNLIKYKKTENVPTGIALKRKGLLFCDTVSSALL